MATLRVPDTDQFARFGRDEVIVNKPNGCKDQIDLLASLELHPDSEDLEVAFQIGLTHVSYVYENEDLSSELTPGVIDALIAMGKDWFDRELAARLYLDRSFDNVGTLSNLRARARVEFNIWALHSTNLSQVVRVGHGIDTSQLTTRMASDVIFTLFGKLVHSRFGDVAIRLVNPFLVELLAEEAPSTDPITALTRLIPLNKQAWTYSKQGPDHDSTFEATLSIEDGRRMAATAGSKKAARAQAADNFVRRFGSYETTERASFFLPRCVPLPPTTKAICNALVGHLAIDPDWRPLVEQSFLHSSWVYENKELARKANQVDNRLLAFVGATVLSYDYTRSVVSSLIDEKPNKYMHLSQTNESLTLAARLLHLDRAILVGKGQKNDGVRPEMAAAALQALAGALYLSLGEPENLLALLSSEWARAMPLLMPAMPRDQDPTTKLQELLTKTGVDHIYSTVDVTGPTNNQSFVVELRATSNALDRSISVRSSPASSIKGARADAARPMVRALEWIRQPVGHPAPSIASHVEFFRLHLDAVDQLRDSNQSETSSATESIPALVHKRNGDSQFELKSQKDKIDAKQARLTFAILPDATGTRRFVIERQSFYEHKHPGIASSLDPKRTDLIDHLIRRYKQRNCTIYSGYSTSKPTLENGDNINEDYLILVISRHGGEDAIAISPAARRHATYVVRHEVSSLPWQEVFAHPKCAAKDLGAKRLVFRDRYPLDQYRSMYEKIKLLLDCPPKLIHNRMFYRTQALTYAFTR